MDLIAAFAELQPADSAVDFVGFGLSTRRRDYLAKLADGSPVVLLHDSSPANYLPAIELKHVSVHFQTTCRVSSEGALFEDRFAVITCDVTAPELHEIFLRCVATAADQLPKVANTADLQRSIQRLLDLFRALSRPSGRELVGLWAELFLILQSGDASRALVAWHSDPFERFDFSSPQTCLEVKATVHENRQHEFALEQLRVPEQGQGSGFVASILMRAMNGGASVIDLAVEIERHVTNDPTLRQKLWENVAAALGSDFSARLDRRFDRSYAQQTLMVYSMTDIPRPVLSPDPRITAVRFRVDLVGVSSSLPGDALATLHAVFAQFNKVQSTQTERVN